MVEKIAYPLCIVSIALFVPLAVAAIWFESTNPTLWKIAGTLGILAFASALALSATRATRRRVDDDG